MEIAAQLSCGICHRTFTHRSHLRSHYLRVHRAIGPVDDVQEVRQIPPTSRHALDAAIVDGLTNDYHCSPAISYQLCKFFTTFQDSIQPMYDCTPSLSVELSSYPETVRQRIIYGCTCAFTFRDSLAYYSHITARDRVTHNDNYLSLPMHFRKHDDFLSVCKIVRKVRVVQEGWSRAAIAMDRCDSNSTGCFRCPKQLMTNLLLEDGGARSLIPFSTTTDSTGCRVFSTQWNSAVYEQYCKSITTGHIVLIDFYGDWTTLSKSGTQSASFFVFDFLTYDLCPRSGIQLPLPQ